MTAEVAIMNRSCVALAADSAFTDSRNKVRVGNKLFSMSPNNDIAIMIYGSSAFLGYPWEVLIKSFRSEVGRKEFLTVEDCANSFFEYMSNDNICEPDGERLSYMSIIYEELGSLADIEGKIDKGSAFKKFLVTVKSIYEGKYDLIENPITAAEFRNTFLEDTIKIAEGKLKIDLNRPTYKKALSEYLFTLLTRKKASEVSTGVVFAGYGKNQFFPQLLSYTVDGKHGDSLRLWLSGSHNVNLREERKAVVFPFAQTDMTDLFMSGVSDSHADFMKSFFTEVLKNRSDEVIDSYVGSEEEKIVEKAIQDGQNEKILSIFDDRFKEFVTKNSISPVLRAVELWRRWQKL